MRSSKTIFVPVCVLVSALAFGCNRDTVADGDQNVRGEEAPVAGETPAVEQTPETAAQLSDQGREFVMNAAQHGTFEVEVGRMAQNQAQIPAVKDFAGRMVDEYAKHNDELQKLVRDKNISFPTELADDGKDTKEDLADEEGKAFDEDYVEAVIDRHQKAVDWFEEASKRDQDPELQRWATNLLPTMRNRLEEAKRLKEQTVEPKTGLFN